MEKSLKLFRYISKGVYEPFPNKEKQIEIIRFEYTSKRMGGIPSINAKIMYPICLDDMWKDNVFAEFNGEKYFVMDTPSSRKSTEDLRYEHEVSMLSEREVLKHVFFNDTVMSPDPNGDDRVVAIGTDVTFMGTIAEFAKRMELSLRSSNIDYNVVVDSGVTSEEKFISLKDMYIFDALQKMYEEYKIPYYFEGKNIHIGYSKGKIDIPFKYGHDQALISVSRDNEKKNIINRITGTGSSNNIPFYYPNETSKGDVGVLAGKENKVVQTKDIVIKNKVLFADKFPLDKKCVYRENENKAIFVMAFIGYYGEESYKLNSRYKAMGVIQVGASEIFHIERYRLEIDVLEDTNLNINPTFSIYSEKLFAVGSSYVIKIGDNLMNAKDFHNGDLVTKGKHKFFITCTIRLRVAPGVYGGSFQADASFDAELSGIYSKYVWMIDDRIVELDKYGIHIPESITPELGDYFTQVAGEIVPFSNELMPSVYMKSKGKERFYNAKNNTYKDESGSFYVFENEWSEKKQLEGVKKYEDIQPSIKNVVNADGLNIDMFVEFAYDKNDNDELIDGTNEYQHPYFFGKLRKTDGIDGMSFNLFDCANEKQEMVVSMTTGHCGACEFIIGVGEKTDKNTVQVDEVTGELLRDKDGNVRCGRKGTPVESLQAWQQDTSKREVWVALKKDLNTYKKTSPMPNVKANLKPKAKYYRGDDGSLIERTDEETDKFVLLGITLPIAYIRAAEIALDKELIKDMYENNSEEFSINPSFSRIFLQENPSIANRINENSSILIEYNKKQYEFYVDEFKYKVDDSIIPEISVTISKDLKVKKNSIKKMMDALRVEVETVTIPSNLDKITESRFFSKNKEEVAENTFTMLNGIKVGSYEEGKSGAVVDKDGNSEFERIKARDCVVTDSLISSDGESFSLGIDKETRNSFLDIDVLRVKKKAVFNELEISSIKNVGGKILLSPASGICSYVEDLTNGYKCYLSVKDYNNAVKNEFAIDDLVIFQEFNIANDLSGNNGNRYYWRRCIEVGVDFIVLSKTDADNGSDKPMAGDKFSTLGNKTEKRRQNAIIQSSYGAGSPSIKQYSGINSYSLDGKEVTSLSPSGNMFRGDFFLKTGENVGSEIKATKDEISTKVSNEDMQSAIKQSADSIKLSIKNLPIGGENFYSSWSYIGLKATNDQYTGASVVNQDKRGFTILGAKPPVVTEASIETPFISKGWYNISFYASSRTNRVVFNVYGAYGSVRKKLGTVTLEGQGVVTQRQSFAFEVGDDYNAGTPIFFLIDNIQYEYYTFHEVMIEKGSHASMEWVSSEEDKDQDLYETGVDIDAHSITVTTDSFEVRNKKGQSGVKIFNDVNGVPTVMAKNLNIDNIEAKNCRFQYGSMSGVFLKEPIVITPNNIDEYSRVNEFGDKEFDFSKTGPVITLEGNYSAEFAFYFPGTDNGVNNNAIKFVGTQVIVINKSNVQILISGNTMVNGGLGSYGLSPNQITAVTCTIVQVRSSDQCRIKWVKDYLYKLS